MRNFKKYFLIPALPEEVYLALTLEATIQLWTGEIAKMSTEPGNESRCGMVIFLEKI